MLKSLYNKLCSLNLGLWLICLVMAFLAIGSFSRGAAEGGGLNEMPLFMFLREAPVSFSWWLWICVALIAVLVVNTIVCGFDALRKGRSLAPQLMHLGFLAIVLAHLISAYGGFKQPIQVIQGGGIYFPDGERLTVEQIGGTTGAMGMMTSYAAILRFPDGRRSEVRPNHPLFHKGYGIYIKEVGMMEAPAALFEIHREPGAPAALIGAIFFTIGNLMLLNTRRQR
ncbi:cytochrome C biogenesis protein ResB [Geomesophilobacter sediminis]|uniref:Cytochrome C biogenesis protein ResB n=1 Tax=Geomesophilobacter sediminis TaxID=2798584 RepID=A0A8J7M0K7_9BACT|nr:cytochrome C biogenesis protein ResB [Geomesophilobacter sediminis]MBJ6725697.1 cytochrome C biogenesis protein ResB [Geomesophilobacter sediminis]